MGIARVSGLREFLAGDFFEAQARQDRTEALSQLIKSSGGSGITLDRYNQVRPGMTIAKVETIGSLGFHMQMFFMNS